MDTVELPSVTPDERAELHKEVLEYEHDALVRDLEPCEYFSHLRSKRILDVDDCDEVRAEKTRRSQCERFLDLISRRGSTGFVGLCDALLKRKVQEHLVTKLNKRMAELELSFRRRKAVIVMRERYEEEWFVSAEQEKGISEDDRKSILQDMRDGMPVPDLPPQVKPSNVSRGPAPLDFPSLPTSTANIEIDCKHDLHPNVVLSRSSISSPMAASNTTGSSSNDPLLQSLQGRTLSDSGDCSPKPSLTDFPN